MYFGYFYLISARIGDVGVAFAFWQGYSYRYNKVCGIQNKSDVSSPNITRPAAGTVAIG